MPTTVPSPARIVTVCFPAGGPADWFTASEMVDKHLNTNGTAVRRYRVRHRRIVGWFTRFFGYQLVDAAKRLGSYMYAAGGRISRLDLSAISLMANDEAICRHRAWHRHIATTTPLAKPWEFFLDQHRTSNGKISRDVARSRFEAQQRVLAMLAYDGAHTFDPYDLEAYQAGEATYAAMCWKTALVGDVLITADGKVLKPAGPNLADRLRFLGDAAAYLRSLKGKQYLCAIAIN